MKFIIIYYDKNYEYHVKFIFYHLKYMRIIIKESGHYEEKNNSSK